MDSEPVPRAYRSALRERQAQETRARVIRAAGELFSRHGYQATTMTAIAREAGVSAETVKAAAGKAELLIAAFEMLFAGAEGQQSLADAPVASDLRVGEGDDFLPAVLGVIAEANARGHALWTVLLGAAMSDPQVADALEAILTHRRADYLRLVDELADRGARFDDRTRTAAELSFLLSPEGYQQLVEGSGWSRDQYTTWLQASVERVAGVDPRERRMP